jgi:hypothetical protein
VSHRFELTAQIRRALLAGLAGGGSLTNLAPLCGCSREVLGRAIAAAPGLAAEVAKARAKGEGARRAAKASGAPVAAPMLSLVPPLAPAAAKADRSGVDTRPTYHATALAEARATAARVAAEVLDPKGRAPQRFPPLPEYAELRRIVQRVCDGPARDAMALAILADVEARAVAEDALRFHAHGPARRGEKD